MKVFENGFLKPEFLNPNYRGLVGWPFMTWDIVNQKFNISSDNMVCITDTTVVTQGDDLYGKCDLRIKEFTPKDIPVGELCWMKRDKYSKWRLRVFRGITRNEEFEGDGFLFWEIVPYLIASTPEEAEERRGWLR